jgi:hypothetical protein
MKFYSNKISTKSVSLEEAVKKAKEQPKVRSLDEIIADIKAKQVAAAQAPQLAKTAAAQADKIEKTAAKEPISVKIAVSEELKEAAKPAKAKKPEAKQAAVKNKFVMKLAKELDFRAWEAQQVVEAWKQHASVEKCIANVGGKASDPQAYCKLLQTASVMAEKVVKAASVKKPAEFKKFAKMTPDEEAFLRKYYTKYYGKDYVDSLLGDY